MKAGLLVLLLLSGCALWDQDTFQPSPEPEPTPAGPAQPGPRVDRRDPLVTIDFASADPRYRDPLRYAIRAAEARGRSIQYDVVAVVPSVEAVADGQRRATDVMRAITQDRVPMARLHMGLRVEPWVTAPRVLIYVR
ncbi:MAG: hypothetical protein AB7O80_26970 [Acetobacteraceae bacterium]